MNDQQTNKQHPIPQNFMDVEFKIVGDFTVRQFIYLCITGFPTYLIYQAPIQGFLKSIGVIVFGLLGIILVFVPIDDRSADVWIVNFFRAVYGNNRRVWRKTPVIPKTLTIETIKIVQGEMITLAPTASRRKLEEYLKGITTKSEGDDLDFDFTKSKYTYLESPVTTTTTTSTISPSVERNQVTFQPDMQESPAQESKIIEEKPAIQEVTIKLAKPFIEKPIEPDIEVQLTPQPKSQQLIQKIVQKVPSKIPPILQKILPSKPKGIAKIKDDLHDEFRISTGEIPGRKFVSFSQKEQELILPLREERKINLFTSNEVEQSQRKDIKTLAKELRTIVREIKVENKDLIEKSEQANKNSNELYEISGIVFDNLNNPISDLIIALLDKDGLEIKYARTNSLGKFNIKDTETGDFQIKVLNSELFNLNFDIIKLSINTYPIPLIQIIGKQK